ncbi:hypothetical protein FH972_021421 [Carpinus fangiana]|uniref:Pre-mRNA-processing factor 17 n=1 Tax=Carpinus fangiana TaxID=176857 RepID=A0A5N6KRG7_9ROSI|nr:hypothetical protein FH972_021421 [Carpinus fangiana]
MNIQDMFERNASPCETDGFPWNRAPPPSAGCGNPPRRSRKVVDRVDGFSTTSLTDAYIMALVRKENNPTGKVPTGLADEVVISEASFRSAHREFERNKDPNSKKRKREGKGDSSVVFGEGSYRGPWRKYEEYRPDAEEGDNDDDLEEVEVEVSGSEDDDGGYLEDSIAPQPAAPTSKAGTAYEDTGDGSERTEFLGSEEYDYQGRSVIMHADLTLGIDLRGDMPPIEERKNFHPKKLIHTFRHPDKGHEKRPITATRFFPSSGHVLLTAGADSKILIWDAFHDRRLLRSYLGHTKSISDVDYSPSGRQFLSASFDRSMKQWDTETGACIAQFSTGATPHCIRWNPSQPAEFLAGMSDKKIVQFDVRADAGRKPVQEYDHHLQAVNTITFCDEDRRFITTSDDRSLRAWEYGIPVPIKLVSDPSMYPLVRGCPHPSGKTVLYQAGDNQIVAYDTSKFRQSRKKSWRGMNTAGHAVDVAVSPDGGIVASGDSGGYLCLYDYKTCKMWHKIQTSKEGAAVLRVAWQPRETSKVVTGSLDGSVKYWD